MVVVLGLVSKLATGERKIAEAGHQGRKCKGNLVAESPASIAEHGAVVAHVPVPGIADIAQAAAEIQGAVVNRPRRLVDATRAGEDKGEKEGSTEWSCPIALFMTCSCVCGEILVEAIVDTDTDFVADDLQYLFRRRSRNCRDLRDAAAPRGQARLQRQVVTAHAVPDRPGAATGHVDLAARECLDAVVPGAPCIQFVVLIVAVDAAGAQVEIGTIHGAHHRQVESANDAFVPVVEAQPVGVVLVAAVQVTEAQCPAIQPWAGREVAPRVAFGSAKIQVAARRALAFGSEPAHANRIAAGLRSAG